ncbi:zinc finger protein GLIS2 [Lampris incognitus]|uniref:zinc finger protein GLIS2 n=1 Tax=Lampris incognitus TaxID=2546036 RepID=UPI0024B4D9BC|nr:zinc finger protein GLIS2 [Lampris incognitus]
MLSLDEPLDLKLPSGRTNGSVRLGKRSSASICAPLTVTRPRLLRTTFPSPPSSPDSQSPSQERLGSCFSPPAMDLSQSPSFRQASSPSPSPSSSFSSSPSSPLESPHSSGSPLPHLFTQERIHPQQAEGRASVQGYHFYLPIRSPGAGYNFPSSGFVGQKKEERASPARSSDEPLACRWMKCHLLFDSLQDLVDHINDYHVRPEKDSGYRCQWEGCARNGRGFNARYKMLIHIRTHTNEKPHHCPTCSKSFSRLENLKIHTRSHTGEKPYICPYEGCSKRYSNSSDRFKHTRTHYVDKPYSCKMAGCLKRYTDPSSLRKHIKAHGHFVAQEHGSPGRLEAVRSLQGAQGAQGAAESPYMSSARIIIPGAAASLLGGLGATLPLSALCHARALGHQGAPLFSLGGGGGRSSREALGLHDAPLMPFGLSAVSMLGLGALGLGRVGVGEEEEEGEGEREGEVLNLSARVGTTRGDPLSWVVVPPGAFLLKPAVVS